MAAASMATSGDEFHKLNLRIATDSSWLRRSIRRTGREHTKPVLKSSTTLRHCTQNSEPPPHNVGGANDNIPGGWITNGSKRPPSSHRFLHRWEFQLHAIASARHSASSGLAANAMCPTPELP